MDQPELVGTQEPARRSSPFRWAVSALVVLLVMAAMGAYVWSYARNSCEVSAVEKASLRLATQLKSYDQIYQSAVSASRTSVTRPVSMMQQILMNTRDMEVPACMQTAKAELLGYMRTVIDAFLAYGAGEPEATIQDLIEQSDTHYDSFNTELKSVQQCAPNCIP